MCGASALKPDSRNFVGRLDPVVKDIELSADAALCDEAAATASPSSAGFDVKPVAFML